MSEQVISKFEEAVQRDSEEIIRLTKRHFWNTFILIGFTLQPVAYCLMQNQPQRIVIWMGIIGALVASGERMYLQKRIKKTVIDLATCSMIIDFLKKHKNDSICSR